METTVAKKQQELYFVIGGGINRTKNPTMDDALAHARVLFEQRNEVAGRVLLGIDPAAPGSDQTVIQVMEHGSNRWSADNHYMHGRMLGKSAITEFAKLYGTAIFPGQPTPKIERKQCVKSNAPLYIVKVVAVVEQEAPRVKVRQPKGDELA